jgi:selenocysteine lyase/cysteine desulfurase
MVQATRREFLTAIGAGTLALPDFAWAAAIETDLPTADEMLFSPGLIYMSTATLGPCPRRVVEESMRAWYTLESSPSAMGYGEGAVLVAAERVRQQAAELLGCSSDEIMITRSTTDGMNAIAQGLRLTSGQCVLTTDQEHEGGSEGWQHLEKRYGVRIDRIEIPPGENDPGAIVKRLAAAIQRDTRVISVSHILSSTGLRMPLAEISALARSRGIFCVVDGAQAVGGVQVDVRALGCHAYATSGHKWLMGPKGTGLLYLAKGTEEAITPMQFHDGRLFYAHATGVGNLPGAVGLGVAIDSLRTTGMAAVERHNIALRNRFYDGLRELRKATIVSAVPGPLATPLITFRLPTEIDSQVIATRLREQHKMIVKMVPKRWLNGIRLSPHIFNTEKEVDTVLSVLSRELV